MQCDSGRHRQSRTGKHIRPLPCTYTTWIEKHNEEAVEPQEGKADPQKTWIRGQACSAAARVLLASPSRTLPSSASSCWLIFLYEAFPHAEDPRFLWIRFPFLRFYGFFIVFLYPRGVCARGRTDVFSRPRRPRRRSG